MVFCGRWKNRTDRNRKPHELQPQIARTANRTTRHRKPHAPQPQTARTATANRSTATTNRNGTAVLTYF
jgi:hypothetical protein